MSPETVALAAGIVLACLCAGAFGVLAVIRFAARHEQRPQLDLNELRDVLRAERATMRADFAEHLEQAEGVSETVQRHRRRTSAAVQRLEQADARDAPPQQLGLSAVPEHPEVRRERVTAELRAAGKLP